MRENRSSAKAPPLLAGLGAALLAAGVAALLGLRQRQDDPASSRASPTALEMERDRPMLEAPGGLASWPGGGLTEADPRLRLLKRFEYFKSLPAGEQRKIQAAFVEGLKGSR